MTEPSPTQETGTPQPTSDERFVAAVRGLPPGKRAILRRNAGNTLAESRGCNWFYLLPRPERGDYELETCFLVACLIATATRTRKVDASGGVGRALRRLYEIRGGGATAEEMEKSPLARRVGLLIDATFADGGGGGELAYRLRQIVKMADAAEIPLPWDDLLKGLRRWTHPARRTQKTWAREFFSGFEPDAPDPSAG